MEKRGRGRPRIGTPTRVTLSDEVVAAADAVAAVESTAQRRVSRGAIIRRWIEEGMRAQTT